MLSLNCLILNSEKSLTVDIGENYYTDDNVEIKFPDFKVSHLKEKLFRRQIIKDITRSSEYIDLWKVDSKKVDEEKGNLKEFIVDDIKDKLGGVMMVGQNKLKRYFDKMSEEEQEGIHVFIVSTSTGKCLPTFYLSNKKFAVTKYRVWSDLFFFRVKAGPSQGSTRYCISR
jgi:hypothetical protein